MSKLEVYKLAIEARDKLNENYHKWMTFYYVANGAVLVSVVSLITSTEVIEKTGILILSVIGIFISMFWHLSCKGYYYYYWSKSWIEIIIKLENELINSSHEKDIGVYSVFSKKVFEEKGNIFQPNSFANISTPKLTLIFSFITIVSWLIYSLNILFVNFECLNIACKIVISGLIILLMVIFYGILLPKWAKSIEKDDDLHKFI